MINKSTKRRISVQ